ncbi:hypothetical protein Tco_1031353 [Tanacetum coccineum]|uniref:Uncharacterized protein n=1 Tax=Tanacetum coccineum TaxID=301880 RepID=A0ABQ5GB10_9ASTR
MIVMLMKTMIDDEDDDDDEGPSARSNQGKSAKRRRHDSGASGFRINLPQKMMNKVRKIPRESFKPIPESERPATPEPEWTIPPNDFPEPDINWANTYATTYKVPAEPLQWKSMILVSLIKGGPPGQVTIQPQFFFNKDLDYLLTGDKEQKIALSKLKAVRYLDFGLEELVPSSWVESEHEYDINQTLKSKLGATGYYFKKITRLSLSQSAVVIEIRNDQRKLMRLNELHKFSDGTLTRVMEKLDHMVKDFQLFEYNKGMETRKWSENDKRRSKDFITAIEKILQIRRIYRSLESFVGGRIRDIDYRLINRTT